MKLSDLRKRELSPEPTREEYVKAVKEQVYTQPGARTAEDYGAQRPWGLENIFINGAQIVKYRLEKKGSAIPERVVGFETKVGRDADGLYVDFLWRPPWPIRSVDTKGNTHNLTGFRIYARDLNKYRVGY